MNKKAIAFLAKMEEVKKARATKQKQLQEKPKLRAARKISEQTIQLIPTQELRTNFPYTCEDCKGYMCYDTLFINDMTGKYIAIDRDTLRPHRCRIKKKLEE